MNALYSTTIKTDHGTKQLAVYHCDVCDFDQDISILTTSAYVNGYYPSTHSVFGALNAHNISVKNLAMDPEFDLRPSCHTWLSKEIQQSDTMIHRIGCVELIGRYLVVNDHSRIEQSMINSIRSYFAMLDIAAIYDVDIETIALPLLGSGDQHMSAKLMLIPILNECVSFLKRNSAVKRIFFIEKNAVKAEMIADYIQNSYSIIQQSAAAANEPVHKHRSVFISYASEDKNIADNLCSKLEMNGIPVWYAPRDVKGVYAASITQAIDDAAYFVVILSQNSMRSEHVLNEIDLAFQNLPNGIKFKPLRIDDSVFTPSFKYYLSRQHWMDAIVPPLEDRLNEFVEKLLTEA